MSNRYPWEKTLREEMKEDYEEQLKKAHEELEENSGWVPSFDASIHCRQLFKLDKDGNILMRTL